VHAVRRFDDREGRWEGRCVKQRCPGCEATREPTEAYVEWLILADRAIDRGLNANAIWRLHERHGRNRHGGEYDLGGEA
jgi:hypothetical protein